MSGTGNGPNGTTTSAGRLALDRLLRPRSVAIVGASDKPGALGASVLSNLVRQGFTGGIHLVNPNRTEIGGRSCVPSVADLPMGVDAAVLAIPRAGVVDVVRGLGERRCGAAVIFSAGFAEDGPQGLADQQEIARIAADAGMVLEGPNCLGLVNFLDNVSLTFIDMPEARAVALRRLAIVSQSGAMAAVLATTMIAREVPLASYVSTGNEAGSGVEDWLEHLVGDPAVAVIAMVVEHVRRPQRFLAAARAAHAAGQRVVLLHPGRSAAGAASAATHTGALAGDHAVMRTHVAAAGVVLVDTLEALGDVAELLVRMPAIEAGSAAVVAESGALKAMLLDQAEAVGLALPALHDADSPGLRAALPPFVPVSNPLDVTAQGLVDPGLYGRVIQALTTDPRIDTILVTLIQTTPATARIKMGAVLDAIEAGLPKPLLIAGVDEGGGVDLSDIAALRAAGLLYLPTPERSLRALAAVAHARAPAVLEPQDDHGRGALPVIGRTVPEYLAKRWLADWGLPFARGEMANDFAMAIASAERLGFPVALKAQSADLPHKSDAGGVVLGLKDAGQVESGYARLMADVGTARPDLVLDGVLVEPMAPRGVELIVGARRDPHWGATLLVGFGGVAAELLHDVALLPADASELAITKAIGSLRLAPLLNGFRGAPIADVAALAELVATLGRIVIATPEIEEVDLNPVLVFPQGQGVLALDALISLAEPPVSP